MKYTKPAKTFEEQADLLIERGLIAEREQLIKKLQNVNYYRLSGYLFPYKDKNENFIEGTYFSKIWRTYNFDRKLRLLVFDAIERIEVKARTLAAYHIAHNYGPFSCSEKRIFPRLNVDFDKWIGSILDEYDRNQELFKNHFKLKYGDTHSLPPIWISIEIMSFGDVVRIFRSYDSSLSKELAKELKIPDKVLESWLLSLNYIRNMCAHHSRLWNKMLSVKPLLPNSRKYKQWDIVDRNSQSHLFVIIAICSCFLKTIAPKSSWKNRVFDLLKEYPEVDIKEMGFPHGWKEFLEQI